MKVLDFNVDQEAGFVYITVDSKNSDETMTVQCCLKTGNYDAERDWGNPVPFLLEIEQDDCGHDDGICGDVNKYAFDYWGENRCMTALFRHAEKNGIKLI